MQLDAVQHSSLTKVLLLGVDRYKSDYFSNLLSPRKDAEKLEGVFADPNAGGVTSENLVNLTSDIDKSTCLKSIENLIGSSKPHETLTFYFAGHGLIHDSKFYLCLSETNEKDLSNTAISSDELDILFSNFEGRGLLLILDCCRSAGFAELAPSFFSSLGDKDFKILLSASRSEQNSWELENERGTLFTKHLIRVLSGKVIISRTSGLIYFSELFDHLSLQMVEDLQVIYPNAPKQEIVFSGVYNRDPLLFVHKDLTLKQISVRTTRYSKSYINKLARRAVIAATSILLFGFGTFYTVMDKSEYVVINNEQLQSFRGMPGISIFGFPEHLWTFNLDVDDIKNGSPLRNNEAITSTLNQPILPIVLDEVKSYKKAEFLIDLDSTTAARDYLLSELRSNPADEEQPRLLQQLKRVLKPGDTVLLETLFNDQDINLEAKKYILGNLAKINLRKAVLLLSGWSINPIEDFYNHEEIISHMDEARVEDIERYIGALLTGGVIDNITPLIFEAAIRHELKLRNEDLIFFMKNIQYSGGEGMGYYLSLMENKEMSSFLQDFLNATHKNAEGLTEEPDWYAARYALSALWAYGQPISICDQVLDYAIKGFYNEALALLLDQCPELRTELINSPDFLRQHFQNAPYMIKELARKKMVDVTFVLKALENIDTPYQQEILIQALALLGDTLAVPRLLEEIPFNETNILPTTRVAAIQALKTMGIPYQRAEEGIPNEWEEVTVEALNWQFDSDPENVYSQLINLLEGDDNYRILVSVLAGKQPSTELLDAARAKAHRSGPAKMNSAALIGMFGSTDEVVDFLVHPDVVFRNQICNYVPYNEAFLNILELVETKREFPNEVIKRMQTQHQFISKARDFINKLPPAGIEWAQNVLIDKYEDDLPDGTYLLIEYKLR